ncbi:MAG: outer membrane beta-barrel domain-containing protein [Candidatus Latescibacteria bacterium]|nr:outer membrane beta-barrel domain-containing protein [Candidatus Latescibacterota bacterium]
MYRSTHAWGVCLSLALAGMPVVGAAQTETPAPANELELNAPHVLTEKKVRLSKDGNNVVRSGPGNTFSIVGVYSKGSEFLVIAKREEWYNVRLSDTITGWIHSSLCEEFDDMSDLEFRPNPKLFSRVGSFALTGYTGGYSFDRKSNSLVFGGHIGYYLFEFIEIDGTIGYTHIVRPAEIVESLFGLTLEEEDFHMLFYAMNLTWKVLPGRQLVPFVTGGAGSSIMEGETETTFNWGVGLDFFVKKHTALRFEFRNYMFESGVSSQARQDYQNFEFGVGISYLL